MYHANSSIFTVYFSHAHSELGTGWLHESNLITAIPEKFLTIMKKSRDCVYGMEYDSTYYLEWKFQSETLW